MIQGISLSQDSEFGAASLVAQLVKNLPVWETWVRSLGWEDPLEKGKATHSSILAWRIPWTVESMELQRVGHNWATFTFTGRPRIKNLPSNEGNMALISGQGTKIPHATEQGSLPATARVCVSRWKIPHDSMKNPRATTKICHSQINRYCSKYS